MIDAPDSTGTPWGQVTKRKCLHVFLADGASGLHQRCSLHEPFLQPQLLHASPPPPGTCIRDLGKRNTILYAIMCVVEGRTRNSNFT